MPSPKATALEQSESINVVDGGDAVVVTRGETSRRIPARWLRLLACGPADIHPKNGQRLFDSVSLPSEVRVRNVTQVEESGNWEVRFESETSNVIIEIERLLACIETEEVNGPEQTPFSSADPSVRAVDYETLESPAALRSFLEMLFRRGYARVRDVPSRPNELERFARRLGVNGSVGFSGVFEETVSNDGEAHANAREDSLPHTAEPYRDPPPAFHMRLCLETSGSGGEMVVVDGLTAAATLAAEEPLAAVELTRWPMLFQYRDETADFRRSALLLETSSSGSLRRITFNDRAAVDFVCPEEQLPVCSSAYDKLARIVLREGLQNTFRVQTGDLLILDNERVLHGRRRFAAGGSRRLACGYLDRTELFSTWRRARFGALD